MGERVWEPHERQCTFYEIPDSVFEVLYGGAAGGGKSDAIVLLPVAREFYKLPKFKGIIFRRTYKELEAEIILRSMDWYPDTGAEYNVQDKRWHWPKYDSYMFFGNCENEQDIRKYDSAEYNLACFDELTHFTEFQYTYFIHSRVRTSRPGYPTIVRSGTNPGNIGHIWVKKRFIDIGPPDTVYRDTRTGDFRIFIPCLAKDNPHIDPKYASRLEGLPDGERQAKAYGDWEAFEGQVFTDWRPSKILGEPSNALHVIDKKELPEWWPKLLVGDWGFKAMTYFLWATISPEGRLYFTDEYAAVGKKIVDWSKEVQLQNAGQRVDKVILCKSSWQSRGEELTIADQFRQITGWTPHRPDNDRIAGKLAIQEYLRFRQKPRKMGIEGFSQEKAAQILRTMGIGALDAYRASFEEEPEETNLPKLQIMRNCQLMIKMFPQCVYEKDNKDGKPSEDVREFSGDDPYDVCRYTVRAAQDYKKDLTPDAEKHEKVALVVASHIGRQDQTAFYRAMERIDRRKTVAIRTHHRARR